MQSIIDNIENLVSRAGEIAETKVELWKLRAAGKISETVSSIISVIAVVILTITAITILSIGGAFWIGSAMGMMESFSPSNMIRTALRDVVQSPDIRSAAINTAIGMGAGLLGRKLVVGNSGNMFKKITGTAVQFLVANFVRKKIPEMQKKT